MKTCLTLLILLLALGRGFGQQVAVMGRVLDASRGQYQVLATAVGFRKGRTAAFAVGAGNVRVPALVLVAAVQALGEVEVVGRKPLLEMQAGKTVVNVAR